LTKKYFVCLKMCYICTINYLLILNIMKKLLLAVALFCGVALSAQAQEFTPFRVDGGVGYGLPFNDGLDGGVLFYLEPKYEVIPQISVGIRWEGALFAGAGEGVSVSLSSAYMATGDYFFNNNKFRPFVGLGLGAYSIGGTSVKDDQTNLTIEVDGKTNFGALLRAGFDVSHFRLAVAYNYGGNVGDETFHFFSATVGFYIGGGKK
jgi:outer membrane protein X